MEDVDDPAGEGLRVDLSAVGADVTVRLAARLRGLFGLCRLFAGGGDDRAGLDRVAAGGADLDAFMTQKLGAGMSNPTVAAQMGKLSPMALVTQFQVLLFMMNHMGEFDPSSCLVPVFLSGRS